MIVKYKVSDFAKDLNLSTKKVLDELAAMGSTGKKNSSNLEENELNYLLEKFSKDNSEKDLAAFLNSAKQPKEEPKAEDKKPENKAPKAEGKQDKKPAAQPAANNQNSQPKNDKNNSGKHGEKKNEQHKKREEKTVSLSELARETGAKATAGSAQSVSVRREDHQVTVDTRTVDMNVDRFDAVEDAAVKGKAWIVLTASDASEKTVNRLNYYIGDLVDVIRMPLTQDRLADVSRKPVAVYAVTDRNLAKLCFDRLSDCGAIKNEEDMSE